jgi:hypothetical protein
MTTLDSDIGRFSLDAAMFLCQPLLEVLAGRGIDDIDAFLQVPSWNDLPYPFAIPSMERAPLVYSTRPGIANVSPSLATTTAMGSWEPTSYAAY